MDADPEAARQRVELTRRSMLKLTGVGAVGVGLWLLDERAGLVRKVEQLFDGQTAAAILSFTTAVHRRDDMLDLQFSFYNLQLVTGAPGPRLVRQATGDAYVVVGFPPQAIGEEAIIETDSDGVPPPPPVPVRAFLADRTRVAFKVPDSTTSIPYTLDALLGWTAWTLSNPAVAQPAPQGTPTILEPSAVQTAIEVPWRLVLAPDPSQRFAHATRPVVHANRTELWHSRLAVSGPDGKPDERAAIPATARAVWTPDSTPSTSAPAGINPPTAPEPITPNETATNRRQRYEIVRQTSDYSVQQTPPGPPPPLTVNRLMLSSLGAWSDLRGTWKPHSDPIHPELALSVTDFINQGTQARDHFVRVIEAGFLFPFGHFASLVAVTERKLERPGPTGPRGAYLRKRRFIVVHDPVKRYGADQQYELNHGRAFPFTSVELSPLVTPTIIRQVDDIPSPVYGGNSTDPHVFWPKVNGVDFQWGVRATDLAGRQINLTMPLLFVLFGDGRAETTMSLLRNYYNGLGPADGRRARDLGGQTVAFAQEGTSKPGSTSLETGTFVFASEPARKPVQGEIPAQNGEIPEETQPYFFPTMAQADVHLAAAAAVSGRQLSAPTIKLDFNYIDKGLIAAAGAVFATLVNPVSLPFSSSSDHSGGVAGPDMAINALSRDFGTVGGDLNALRSQKFDPGSYFPSSAKLLGDIKLSDILAAVGFDPPSPDGLPDPKVPGLKTEVLYPNGDHTKVPDAVRVTYLWKPKLQPFPTTNPLFDPIDNGTPATLTLQAVLFTPVGQPGAPTSDISGDLRNFTLWLIGKGSSVEFLVVHFERLAFSSHNGAKPTVDVRISKVAFGGALKFVNPLEALLKSLGNGPTIDVQPTGVTAGYTLPLPSLAIGVLSLENMSLSASLTIPFNGDPMRARFAFCSREHPFTLTVSLFGGGGFFAIAVGAQGIESVEAALEFGGNFSFDIGIASGGIHLLAGIYFKYTEMPTKSLELNGYVRLGGELSVLGGIVSISIELYIALGYKQVGNEKPKAVGVATLTISVHILFFISIDASFSVRKEFSGGGDPTFAQLVAPADWDAYCDAFAAA